MTHTDEQPGLFDIEPPQRAPDAQAVRPTCSECGRPLRSRRSIAAAAGDHCAAKVGRAVLARRGKVRKTQGPAAA